MSESEFVFRVLRIMVLSIPLGGFGFVVIASQIFGERATMWQKVVGAAFGGVMLAVAVSALVWGAYMLWCLWRDRLKGRGYDY